ncbi:hypothetical protein L6V77_34695, partial [Myxococcota bacterium]|nr:hypothetical protein [Myxococcota bacterium]
MDPRRRPPIAVFRSALTLALAVVGCADAEPTSALSPRPDGGPVPDVPWSAAPSDAESISPDVALRPPGDAAPPARDTGADTGRSAAPDAATPPDPKPDAATPPDPEP